MDTLCYLCLTDLANVGSLIPLLQILDNQSPLGAGATWVQELEPGVLREDLGSGRQDVPVAATNPRNLGQKKDRAETVLGSNPVRGFFRINSITWVKQISTSLP